MPLTKAEQKKLFTLLGKQLSDAGPERQWAREDADVPVKNKKRVRQQSYDDQEESPIDQVPLLTKARAQQQQVQATTRGGRAARGGRVGVVRGRGRGRACPTCTCDM
jgi:hypothetical protein